MGKKKGSEEKVALIQGTIRNPSDGSLFKTKIKEGLIRLSKQSLLGKKIQANGSFADFKG